MCLYEGAVEISSRVGGCLKHVLQQISPVLVIPSSLSLNGCDGAVKLEV